MSTNPTISLGIDFAKPVIGSSALNDGLFRVIVVSGRISDFPPNNLEYEERVDFLSLFDCLPLDKVEAAEDSSIP